MASYEYAAGKLRSMENRLLTKTDIERMVDAPDLESAFKVFNDTDYADNISDVLPHEFKKALDDDFRQARDELNALIENENLRDFLFIRNDIRNIKVLFKMKFSDKDLSEDLKDFGTAETDNLKKYILEDDAAVTVPKKVKTIVDKAKVDLAQDHDPFTIDAYFDEAYFQAVETAVKNMNNRFIKGLFSLQHKTNTLKFFIRAKLMGKDSAFAKNYLSSKYLAVYDRDLDEALRTVSFHNLLDKAIQEFLNDKNLWRLEKNVEEAELEYLRGAKRIGCGPEIVVAYYYAKRNAIRNVRLIMTGKLNKVEPAKIKERIREIY
ncbi:V-type ATPase subunit [Patescibacteria group bacterium]|nr:V-type ATPase subunit [Patescibacteria group bacterium]MBU1673489.1 V-type ATPase subunit [Patescibacteria group bacterium]MBU1963765.1 V-type ATPase subunit [Patescibacteria group bacterium]